MSEATKKIVLNTSCRLCMDAQYVQTFAGQRSAGHVVCPTLVHEFTPDETQKPNWRLTLTLHGRLEQTPPFSVILLLGAILRFDGRPAFRLEWISVEGDWYQRTNEHVVLGTMPELMSTFPLNNVIVTPGIRRYERLVFGNRHGRICHQITVPVAHIIAEYSR